MICNNTSIPGIQIADQKHKITLFADGIILMLTGPASSLPAVCEIFDRFNACSFYKVNDSKSNILNVGVIESVKKAI